jgi:drug/metabolite transporter (DMT)-like permease
VINRALAPYAWMLCGCLSFAWMGEFAHFLGPTCDWRIVALARSALAFSFALTCARLSGARLVLWRPGILWLRSCTGSLSLLCTFFAFGCLRASEVLTLTNTFPIWVAVLSWPLLRERPSLSVWLAAGCGVLGVALIFRPSLDVGDSARLAMPLALIAAMTSAVAMLGLHRLKDVDPWAIVVHFSGVATLFVLVACFAGERPAFETMLIGNNLWLLLGVGVAATFGQFCLTLAFTAGPPARISVMGLTQPLFALGLDLLFEPAPLGQLTLAGMALVLAPTAWMMAGKTAQ